jgi:hypothetical protein
MRSSDWWGYKSRWLDIKDMPSPEFDPLLGTLLFLFVLGVVLKICC